MDWTLFWQLIIIILIGGMVAGELIKTWKGRN